ncbi:MAG: hypothetical protein GY786_20485 [Proteobacteria bacterium]|nr:hypothetical protein [Pseudomonadota bacterium]
MTDLMFLGKELGHNILKASKILFIVSFIFCSTTIFAQESSSKVKELMMLNHQSIVNILNHILYDEGYEDLRVSVDRIIDHGKSLKKHKFSDNAKANRMFHRQAAQLEAFGKNLRNYVNMIIKDKENAKKKGSHKVVVASSFGQVVTSCVSCHSSFRK